MWVFYGGCKWFDIFFGSYDLWKIYWWVCYLWKLELYFKWKCYKFIVKECGDFGNGLVLWVNSYKCYKNKVCLSYSKWDWN